MRVFAVPMDDKGACTFYRIAEPARVARELGVDIEVNGTIPVRAELNRDSSWTVYEFCDDADIFWVQRPLAHATYAIARQAKKQGVKVIVELDDALDKLHPENTMTSWVDPNRYPLHNYKWGLATIDLADALTVSTDALARIYHKPGRPAFVLRNRLPASALACRPEVSPCPDTIGWTGAMNVHPTDLQDTRGALRAVNAPVRMVGNPTGVAQALRIPQHRLQCASDWIENIEDYYAAVGRAFGVGICPLATSEFNRCKSHIKPAEMLTVGIPAVCSPLPEYELLAEQAPGAVTIARSQRDWVQALRRLTTDRETYELARKAGIDWAEQHTIEHHAHDWVDAWEQVLAT